MATLNEIIQKAGLSDKLSVDAFDPVTGAGDLTVRQAEGPSKSVHVDHFHELALTLNEIFSATHASHPLLIQGTNQQRFFLADFNGDGTTDGVLFSSPQSPLEIADLNDPQIQKSIQKEFNAFKKSFMQRAKDVLDEKVALTGFEGNPHLKQWAFDALKNYLRYFQTLPDKLGTPQDTQLAFQLLNFQAPVSDMLNRLASLVATSPVNSSINLAPALTGLKPDQEHFETLFPELKLEKPENFKGTMVTPQWVVKWRKTGERIPISEPLLQIFRQFYLSCGIEAKIVESMAPLSLKLIIGNGDSQQVVECNELGSTPMSNGEMGSEQCGITPNKGAREVLNSTFSYPDLPLWEYRMSADTGGLRTLEGIKYYFEGRNPPSVFIPMTFRWPQDLQTPAMESIREEIYKKVAEAVYPLVVQMQRTQMPPPHFFFTESETAYSILTTEYGFPGKFEFSPSQTSISPETFENVAEGTLLGLAFPHKENLKPDQKLDKQENQADYIWINLDLSANRGKSHALAHLINRLPQVITHESGHLLPSQKDESTFSLFLSVFFQMFHGDYPEMATYLNLISQRKMLWIQNKQAHYQQIEEKIARFNPQILAYFPSAYALEKMMQFDDGGFFAGFDVKEINAELEASLRNKLSGETQFFMAPIAGNLLENELHHLESKPLYSDHFTTQNFESDPKTILIRLQTAMMEIAEDPAIITAYTDVLWKMALVEERRPPGWTDEIITQKMVQALERLKKHTQKMRDPDQRDKIVHDAFLGASILLDTWLEKKRDPKPGNKNTVTQKTLLTLANELPSLKENRYELWCELNLQKGGVHAKEVLQSFWKIPNDKPPQDRPQTPIIDPDDSPTDEFYRLMPGREALNKIRDIASLRRKNLISFKTYAHVQILYLHHFLSKYNKDQWLYQFALDQYAEGIRWGIQDALQAGQTKIASALYHQGAKAYFRHSTNPGQLSKLEWLKIARTFKDDQAIKALENKRENSLPNTTSDTP